MAAGARHPRHHLQGQLQGPRQGGFQSAALAPFGNLSMFGWDVLQNKQYDDPQFSVFQKKGEESQE